jgi:predicted metalloprotease with PDZ domain
MVPERQVCALCGNVYVAIRPAGRSRRTNGNLCGVCLMLPPPPAAPYENGGRSAEHSQGTEMRLNAKITRLEDEAPTKVAEPDGKGKLGLSVRPLTPPIARELGLEVKEGMLVGDVVEGGRAAEAGIEAGDVIVEIDRQPVRTVEDLTARVDKQAKGEPIVMLVNRAGHTLYVAIPAA